jgi:3-oxoacyl-[acyl-carrier protein] reductase
MTDFLSLQDKTAIVTGAARGIGRAIALELARRGAAVIVNYCTSAEAAEEVVNVITDLGGRAAAFQTDIADSKQAQNLINFAIETYGKIDILVNNAGITRDTLIMMMTEEDWDTVLAVNLKGAFNCSKAAVKHMIRNRYGRIINITSVAGQMGNPGQTNYSASKAGLIGLTKALAREVAARNITVNGIAAGYIDTSLWDDVPEGMRATTLKLVPAGRKGQPEEIAYAVAFLASGQAAYITGQIIGIDGGMAMM